MVILLWVAIAVVAANVLFGAFLLIRYRAEGIRAAEARHRRDETAHWTASSRVSPPGGSSHRHIA
jgi:hypothetical protein